MTKAANSQIAGPAAEESNNGAASKAAIKANELNEL